MTTETRQANAGKYLTCVLGEQQYGLPVLKVREIMKLMAITPVPRMPAHVRGVLNLRGKVIPVTDLRVKFGLPVPDADDRTCIVVTEVELTGRRVRVGVIVDAVSDVQNLTAEEIDERPDFGERVDTDYMLGVAKMRDRVILLLDLDRVLGDDAQAAAA